MESTPNNQPKGRFFIDGEANSYFSASGLPLHGQSQEQNNVSNEFLFLGSSGSIVRLMYF